ncbi:MAG: hypothetical protein WCX31_04520 [Salinivirgaceae bacterium]
MIKDVTDAQTKAFNTWISEETTYEQKEKAYNNFINSFNVFSDPDDFIIEYTREITSDIFDSLINNYFNTPFQAYLEEHNLRFNEAKKVNISWECDSWPYTIFKVIIEIGDWSKADPSKIENWFIEAKKQKVKFSSNDYKLIQERIGLKYEEQLLHAAEFLQKDEIWPWFNETKEAGIVFTDRVFKHLDSIYPYKEYNEKLRNEFKK